jgi:3'-phosphoadenosine 5'-phosphosulfate (PAPS) 3'-phosphatase
MQKKYTDLMNHIAHLGGKIALDLISDSSPYLKRDNSVLTKADTEISKFVYSALSDLKGLIGILLIVES